MPQALAILPVIFSAIGTGFGVASSLGAFTPGQPSTPAPTAAQNIASETAKRQQDALTVNRQIPDLISQTSGGLSDQSYQTFGSTAAGLPGTFGQGGVNLDSIMALLGGSSGGPPTDLYNLASGAQ